MKNLLIVSVIIFTGCKMDNQENLSTVSASMIVGQGETPYLFTDTNNNVYLSWTEPGDSINYLKYTRLTEDNTWATPQTIAQGSDWFVNWADYPALAAQGDHLLTHYLAKSSVGTYSYDVNIKHSNDGGKSWTEPYILHDDSTAAEHGFVSMVPYENNFFVSWLDGRNTVNNDTAHAHHNGAMTIRAAVLTPTGEKLKEWELDDRVCDCCQTTAAITQNGPIVIYRDRSENEIRDMSIVRLIDGKWTKPKAVHKDNWKIAGCPVNGPRVSALGNNLALGWFTAAEGQARVKIKFSKDGGATFGKAFTISNGKPIGRVDVEMLDESTAIISWMEGAEIRASKISDKGEVLETFTIANSSESRSSGFPQITKAGNQLIFAWTDGKDKQIKAKALSLQDYYD